MVGARAPLLLLTNDSVFTFFRGGPSAVNTYPHWENAAAGGAGNICGAF